MTVIKIENLWKEYRLGVIGHGTLTHDLQSWWARIRGREDPNQKIAAFLKEQKNQIEGDRFWALRDINLEVKQGEVLGIIGKNGAGKSTLLKILSRVTAPTGGTISVKGRIASLLEVGTGFHPELTGRENIFMNGAILGMSRTEVKTKLDEIIDFSGIETFIDTPVKRYSSGMYVRLAFAVAAHLEPEILIIDEVLAVGDADFQKKCLGKMNEVAHAGRTVLFVSHNMGAVAQLCSRGISLKKGTIEKQGEISHIVEKYLYGDHETIPKKTWEIENSPGTDDVKLLSVEILNEKGLTASTIFTDEKFTVNTVLEIRKPLSVLGVGLVICNPLKQHIVHTTSLVNTTGEVDVGTWNFQAEIASHLLQVGEYSVTISSDIPSKEVIFQLHDILRFSIVSRSVKTAMYSPKTWTGLLCPEVVRWNKVGQSNIFQDSQARQICKSIT